MGSTHQKPSIGFIGLGLMGYGIATNLVRKGYQVHGYDISSSTLDRFEKDGGHACQTISELTKGNDYYICMVASVSQVQSVLFDTEDAIIKTLPKGSTFVLCSTVPASYVKSVQEQFSKLDRNDIYFVDSPVSGGAARAAAGTLTIMAGGSETALAKAKWLLKDMSASKKLFIVGDIGAGSNMKMAHQVLAGIQILAASEAMGFASKLGIDPRKIRDEVCTSDGWSWMYENRVPRMLEEDYFPGVSALTIILKDVALITSSALQQNFPTPLVSVAEQVYLSALTLGFGGHDDAGMVRTYYTHPISKVTEYFAKEPDKLQSAKSCSIIIRLLKAIHLCAAAEAITFTHHLGIDLEQFYELCIDAAGNTPNGQVGKMGQRQTIHDVTQELEEVLQAAQKVQSPLHLGAAARNLLLLAERKLGNNARDFEIVRLWQFPQD